MRVAAIDCGTNSIRLLIADIAEHGGSPRLTDVVRLMRVVRLGQGVDATGRLAPAALERTFAALDEYAELIRAHRADAVRFVATSATRDASNREDFVDGVRARLGVEPEVVAGEEEAQLSFAGAVSVFPPLAGEKVLVVDLGGGSTEFVVGGAGGVEAALSVDMGCVRFTERFLHDDPPTPQQVAAAEAEAERLLDEVERTVPLHAATRVIGVAGSITTVTAHALDLNEYRSSEIDGAELPIRLVEAAAAELLSFPRERRAGLPFMHPGRVDVIGAGALIWRTILRRLEDRTRGGITTALASEHDILDGIALGLFPAPGDPLQ
ncbi:hydrolase [Zafaria cholistanensis]|uniref:Hydrolase n=2 Tax=Zafaria cholistanensis TaxID=1682741 RepID=A0A5A7NSF8_9MICC|nr:hydrolase [Zafaria cholistanensis]